jgi:hypothetical protein
VDISKKILPSPYPHKGKMKKNPPPNRPTLKRKKSGHFECMLSLPIGCMKFLFLKLEVLIYSYP